MPTKKITTESSWTDPDDAPHLTREWFESAEIWEGDRLIRPAKPARAKKGTVNLPLDPEVIAHFRAGGPGWQARINKILREAAGLKAP